MHSIAQRINVRPCISAVSNYLTFGNVKARGPDCLRHRGFGIDDEQQVLGVRAGLPFVAASVANNFSGLGPSLESAEHHVPKATTVKPKDGFRETFV
jgi:hypothetical protein